MILDATSRAILDFEQAWPPGKTTGKGEAIRTKLSISPVRYYQLLGRLIDDAGASAAYPQLCSRLRRLRDERATARARRMS